MNKYFEIFIDQLLSSFSYPLRDIQEAPRGGRRTSLPATQSHTPEKLFFKVDIKNDYVFQTIRKKVHRKSN